MRQAARDSKAMDVGKPDESKQTCHAVATCQAGEHASTDGVHQ
jgi:hypothetical protein